MVINYRNTLRDFIQSVTGTNAQAEEISPTFEHAGEYGVSSMQIGGGTFMQSPAMKGRDEWAFNQHLTQEAAKTGLPVTALWRNVYAYGLEPQPHDVLVALMVEQGRMVQESDAPYLMLDIFEGMNAIGPMQDAMEVLKEANQILAKEYGDAVKPIQARGSICIEDSPNLTVENCMEFAGKLLDAGYEGLYLKSASGRVDPKLVGELTDALFEKYGDRIGTFGVHIHDTYGAANDSYIRAARAAVKHDHDIELDVQMPGFGGNTAQPDIILLDEIMHSDDELKGHLAQLNHTAIAQDTHERLMLRAQYGNRELKYDPLKWQVAYNAKVAGGASATLRSIPQLEANLQASLGTKDWKEIELAVFEMMAEIAPEMGHPTQVTPYANTTMVQAAYCIVNERGPQKNRWAVMTSPTVDYLLGRLGEAPLLASEERIAQAHKVDRSTEPKGYMSAKERDTAFRVANDGKSKLEIGKEALIAAGIKEPTPRQILSAVLEKGNIAVGVERVVGIAFGNNKPQAPDAYPAWAVKPAAKSTLIENFLNRAAPGITEGEEKELHKQREMVGRYGLSRFEDIAQKALMLKLMDEGRYSFGEGFEDIHAQIRERTMIELIEFRENMVEDVIQAMFENTPPAMQENAQRKVAFLRPQLEATAAQLMKKACDGKGTGVYNHFALARRNYKPAFKGPRLVTSNGHQVQIPDGADSEDSTPAQSIAGGAS